MVLRNFCESQKSWIFVIYADEEAASVTLGYILTMFISVVLLSMLLLTSQTFIRDSSDMVMSQSFDVFGSNLAMKITGFDRAIRNTIYSGGSDTTLETEFEFPAEIAGRGYSINVTDYGAGTSPRYEIILRAEGGRMNRIRIPLNISTSIQSDEFSSYQESITISYNSTSREMELS